MGQLHHLLIRDDGQLAGVRDEPGVCRVDTPDVGEDLAAFGLESGRQSDTGRVGAATAEGSYLRERRVVLALALEAGHDHDPTGGHLGVDPLRVDAGDARLAVVAVGGDPGLSPGERDRRNAQGVQRHRDESGALMLARREKHVELARIRVVGDGAGKGEELVGRIAHRRDDDHQVAAGRPLTGDTRGDAPDPVGVGYGRATELLHDERFRHGGHSISRRQPVPTPRGGTAGLAECARGPLSGQSVPNRRGITQPCASIWTATRL